MTHNILESQETEGTGRGGVSEIPEAQWGIVSGGSRCKYWSQFRITNSNSPIVIHSHTTMVWCMSTKVVWHVLKRTSTLMVATRKARTKGGTAFNGLFQVGLKCSQPCHMILSYAATVKLFITVRTHANSQLHPMELTISDLLIIMLQCGMSLSLTRWCDQ